MGRGRPIIKYMLCQKVKGFMEKFSTGRGMSLLGTGFVIAYAVIGNDLSKG